MRSSCSSPHVELEIRGIHLSLIDAAPARVVIGPTAGADGPTLAIRLDAADAHTLLRELRGQQTILSQTAGVVSHVAAALGGHFEAVALIPKSTGNMLAALQIRTPGGIAEVPVEPGHGLALSVSLGVPLYAAAGLFAI